MQRSCPGCGARLAEEVSQCDICGTSASEDPMDFELSSEEPSLSGEVATPAPAGRGKTDSEGDLGTTLFCNQCGTPNPPDSRFCNKCGSRITVLSGTDQAVSGATESEDTKETTGKTDAAVEISGTEDPERSEQIPPGMPDESSAAYPPEISGSPSSEPDAARQVGIIVGAGLLIVIVWYIFTIVIHDQQATTSSGPSETQSAASQDPVPAEFKERETALRSDIGNSEGELRIASQKELIDMYISASRPDLAAAEAEKVAEVENTEEMWLAVANLYYDWMETIDRSEKGFFALKSISAYRRVLAINPENLDARTDMAIAYMYDPDNPRMAIQETLKVLEYDSLHVNANFNRAVMLLQIDRVDEALKQLEKVKRLVADPNNPVYQRAEQVIAETRARG